MSASDSLGQNPPTSAMSHSVSSLSPSSAADRTAADRFEGMLATAVTSPFFLAGAAMTIALGVVGVLVAGR